MMNKVIEILVSPYLLFSMAGIILVVNFLRRNNNFFDVRSIFTQQFAMFKNCKGQIIVFYIVPLILAIGIVRIRLIDKDIINNINIVLSIFVSMLFAMLSILSGYEKNNNTQFSKVLDETNNTIIFETVLCIIILILSFIVLFINNFEYSISLIIKHTITQSRIKLFPLIKSVKLAIITTTKYAAFRIIPLNPALLSSLPVSDFGLLWNIPAKIIPNI